MKGESKRKAASNVLSSVVRAALVAGRRFAEVEPQLDDLQIPVAEVAPEELVDDVRGFVEAILCREPYSPQPQCDSGGRRSNGPQSERSSPGRSASDQFIGIDKNTSFRRAVHVHEDEAGGIPYLVGKGAIAVGTRLR